MKKPPSKPSSGRHSGPSKNKKPLHKSVALFTAPGCPWCARAKSFLKKLGVRFNTVDVSTNKKALTDCKKAGCSGVPVVLIGSQWICGYNEEKIKKALGL